MAPRITIIGGGSHQWVPRLVNDIAHTKMLREADIVLEDIDGSRLPHLQTYVEHVATVLGIPPRVRTTTDQRDALTGADFVIVNISTGGLRSMAHDLDLPTRYGIYQSVGDTVGPGGVMRSLRNIPVLIGIARDMEERCPDAWLLNLTNPMTTLCRAVTRETSVRTIGLCHEVTITHFYLSLLLDVLAEQLRRVVAAQELTVEAALTGDPGLAFDAMLADPLAGRIDYDQLRQLTGEMLDATREWLPQFG